LTVVNYKYKLSTKHEKRHISISNIELGVKLTEFHNFSESVFLQGFIRKRGGDIKDVGLKSIFHHGTKLRMI
jgi:hypothetical protein